MSLTTLPYEFFDTILSHLKTIDLSRVSLVSKKFHKRAEPFLYSTYSDGLPETCSIGPHKAFLRTILQRPELCKYVKTLQVSVMDDDCENPLEDFGMDVSIFEEPLSKLDIPEDFRERLKEGLDYGHDQADIALLLCLLPNLEKLHLGDSFKPELISEVLELASVDSPDGSDSDSEVGLFQGLSKLGNFCIESDDNGHGMSSFNIYSRVFQIPSVKTFRGVLVNAETEGEIGGLEECTSSVERIILSQTCLTDEVLGVMLRGCKALREFHYAYSRIHFYERHFTGRDAVMALRAHVSTLEELTLLLDEDWDKVHWAPEEEVFMGVALRDFQRLRLLKCGMQSLLGLLHAQPVESFTRLEYPLQPMNVPVPELVDVLPESIEVLTIVYADARIVPHLERLGEEKRHSKLKVVNISFCDESMEKAQEVKIDGVEVNTYYHTRDDRGEEDFYQVMV